MGSIGDRSESAYRIGLPRQLRETNSTRNRSEPRPLLAASTTVRLLYAFGLLATIAVPGSSGWVALTVGGGFIGVAGLPLLALALWRFVQVLLNPRTLDAPLASGFAAWLRVPGLAMAALGPLALAAALSIRPLGRLVAPHGSGNGIEYYVVGLVIALVAGIAPVGLLLFEFSRLRGFEQALDKLEAPGEGELDSGIGGRQ